MKLQVKPRDKDIRVIEIVEPATITSLPNGEMSIDSADGVSYHFNANGYYTTRIAAGAVSNTTIVALPSNP